MTGKFIPTFVRKVLAKSWVDEIVIVKNEAYLSPVPVISEYGNVMENLQLINGRWDGSIRVASVEDSVQLQVVETFIDLYLTFARGFSNTFKSRGF